MDQQITTGLCSTAIKLKNQIETAFIALGKLLYDIKEQRAYEQEYETWVLFLMEVRLTESTASKLMKIYETLVLGYKIPEDRIASAGGWTVVYDLLPLATTKETAEEWLDKATQMTRTDIQREIKESKTGIPMTDCEHEWASFQLCRKCGLKHVDNLFVENKEEGIS